MVSDRIESPQQSPLPLALSAAGDENAVPHRKRDPEIHQEVRAELAIHQLPGGGSVDITVHCGIVHLTGLVESYAQKWAIDRAVRSITGVKDLCDYLHVRPPGDPHGPDGAAALLGINPSTLRSRMKKLGITTQRA